MSDELKEVEVKFKLTVFDPDKSDWNVWSKQFLARANMKGYKNILLGKEAVPTDEDLADPDLKDKALAEAQRLRKLNDLAYNELTWCFHDLVNFSLVDDGRTDGLPEGDAELAWRKSINTTRILRRMW
jgi:hypothetical protein